MKRKLYLLTLCPNYPFDGGLFSSLGLVLEAISRNWNTPVQNMDLKVTYEYGTRSWYISVLDCAPFLISEIDCEANDNKIVVMSYYIKDKKIRKYIPITFSNIGNALEYIRSINNISAKEKIQISSHGYMLRTEDETRYFDQIPISENIFYLLHTFIINEYSPFAYMSGSIKTREWLV
jgi:hypothetical protein